ncbi:hypothetical protein CDD83_1762 [Cordyceps sp. RAO-2017]|nr:hypothetical protein CDD83_1762 [Cordyceps sp. RAO-2017]
MAPSEKAASASRPGAGLAGAGGPASLETAFSPESHPRLGVSTWTRLQLGSLSSGAVGFALGATHGGQMAQLRFRAEHAHKLPDSTTGWYLYHKSKHYYAIRGGVREGIRLGAKTCFWSFIALGLESTVDRCRGSSDMFSTIVATLSVAGAYSLWHKFTLSTAARTAKIGLLFGLTYGGVQDLIGSARGRPIGYVELIRGRFGSASHDTESPLGRR